MAFPTLPLAFVITPGFLAAGAVLASIPIIIHILNRRRFKIVQWAAMEYLLQAMRKNRRRIKFEQLLLLATRCAVLVLLGLALARPLGCSGNSLVAAAGSQSALHVFVIDNSYSMGYEHERPNARTHFDQAKILAKQQIDKLAGGSDSVAIVAAARPKTSADGVTPESQIVLHPGFDIEAARLAVDRLELSNSGTDIPGALSAALAMARDEKQKQPARFLYILSDSTRSAWEDPQEAEQLKQIGRELEGAFGRGRIRLNDLSRAGQWNYAVLGVRPDGALVTTAFHSDFLADVKGFGQGGDAFVQWKWDEKLLPESGRVKPDPNTPPQINTKIRTEDQGGPHVLSVTLVNDSAGSADRLKADNTHHRVLEVAAELKVLIVEGERGPGALSGSGSFLDLALAPGRAVGIRKDSYVAPELITDGELGNKVLADYRAVILTNVASLSNTQADQVEKFVAGGGTLMIFMGEQVHSDSYNSTLLPRGLIPGKLIARKTAADPSNPFFLDFNPSNPPHPVLNVFRGEEKSGLDTARVFTYYQMELPPEAKAETVLKYVAGSGAAAKPTNDPAITIHHKGKGRVVTVTTTANGDWNSLPPKPAYIPLVHELLAGTVDVGDKWMNLTVGQCLETPLSLKPGAAPSLTLGKENFPLEFVTGREGESFYRSKALTKPGVYQLDIGSAKLPVAVNVPADEADVRPLPQEAVRKALGEIDLQLFGDTTPTYALAREDANDLGWFVMLLVLGLVAFEAFLAMAFGHYRRSSVLRGPVSAAAGGK
jgi:hypothetical protein